MKKTDCVLVITDKEFFEEAIKNLNFAEVNLVSILVDGYDEKFFNVMGNEIPLRPFEESERFVEKCKTCTWLIVDYKNEIRLRKVKKFLMTLGIEEKNIAESKTYRKISQVWLANYNHVEKNGADFFATGDEYFRDALDLRFIPCVQKDKNSALGGANLADVNQNLRQSYSIAKNIFAHVKPGTIKFVLIGLSPNYFYRECSEDSFNFPTLQPSANETEADLNFDEIKKEYEHSFSLQSMFEWEENLNSISVDSGEKNTQILRDYIKLCVDNGAKPVGVIFPFSTIVRKTYDKKILASFREIIHKLEAEGDFLCVDMFEMNLDYICFCDMLHLNFDGSMFANAFLSLKLQKNDLIPTESFCEMTYRYLNRLAWVAPKDEFNTFAEKIFDASAKKIRQKDKIKIGFVLIDSAQWSGDDLYNLFANDTRFETTLFDCIRADKIGNELVVKDFWRGFEQFKARNLNIVVIDNPDAVVPDQDVLFFLTPYFHMVPKKIRPENLTLKTLTTHIPYSFSVSVRTKGFYNSAIFHTAWKIFLSSKVALEVFSSNNLTGMPCGVFSGYPRMDIFFEQDSNFHFDWKMARPNAKKIIYAPHWSINAVTRYATFQWNHEFMYEFAKNHPEISWVVKPHQALFFSTVEEKIFPSTKAFEEYLQKWNDLPNAQVYTGAYYQGLFATSDGMIHDSGSFTAEYQFVDKPMIFLTREGEKFNKLGEEILNASYLVDGKDLDGIAKMMQRVFIEGDDYKATQRKEVFDKYLNYPQYNGMLASEFIYKSISEPLKEGGN